MTKEMTVEEWNAFLEERENLRREQAKLEEDLKAFEAAKQLANLANNGATVNKVVTGTIGTLTEYNFEEDWSLWCERLEQYCVANEVPREKQVALLLTMIGTKGYALLRGYKGG